jgi:uncharacterized Zn finger protein (UPF0148 family)
MNCPKCGNPIYQGDVACRNCHLPIMAMNLSQEKTPISSIKEEVSKIETPYIEPTHTETPYIQPDKQEMYMPNEPTKIKTEKKEEYTNYGEGKKAITSIKFLLPIFFGIIALGMVCYGIFTFISTIVEDKKERYEATNAISYQIEFNQFIYTIPSEYNYQKDTSSKTLTISDANHSWTASIQVIDATYSSMQSRKASLKSYFQSIGYTVGDVYEQTGNNTSYLLLDATKNKSTYLLVVCKAGDSTKSFGIVIDKISTIENEEILNNLDSILTTAEYQPNTQENSQTVDFDFTNILK